MVDYNSSRFVCPCGFFSCWDFIIERKHVWIFRKVNRQNFLLLSLFVQLFLQIQAPFRFRLPPLCKQSERLWFELLMIQKELPWNYIIVEGLFLLLVRIVGDILNKYRFLHRKPFSLFHIIKNKNLIFYFMQSLLYRSNGSLMSLWSKISRSCCTTSGRRAFALMSVNLMICSANILFWNKVWIALWVVSRIISQLTSFVAPPCETGRMWWRLKLFSDLLIVFDFLI